MFDVAVIGLGPGGEHVAGTLAEHGLSVLGIDHGLVGGECPYWGCIPSNKMMIRAATALQEARRVPLLAGSVGEVVPDWSIVAQRIRQEATDTWDDTVAVDRFTGKGGTFVRGTGSSSPPAPRPRSLRSRVWVTSRIGRTGTWSRPRRCQRRSSCWAVARSVVS